MGTAHASVVVFSDDLTCSSILLWAAAAACASAVELLAMASLLLRSDGALAFCSTATAVVVDSSASRASRQTRAVAASFENFILSNRRYMYYRNQKDKRQLHM